MTVIHFYRIPGASESQTLRKLKTKFNNIIDVKTEYCFNIDIGDNFQLSTKEEDTLIWLLRETFEPKQFSNASFLIDSNDSNVLIEVGPRLAFSTAFSSNCISMCQACGISSIVRIERSRRYLITLSEKSESVSKQNMQDIVNLLHDRMTECQYTSLLTSFDNHVMPRLVETIPLLEEGITALEKINKELGLGFDEWDLNFYYTMFTETLKRNPTDVECFDLGQSNSEHSRHWYFGGKMEFDGKCKEDTLFGMVKSTLPKKSNSVIAFHDNSSAIEGFLVERLAPVQTSEASSLQSSSVTLHPILTAETHNFPSGVAPFPGAETGTGGRLRDVQATGRGAHTLAGVVGYCVGNLNIPGHKLPWESEDFEYPSNLAKPLDIKVEASNGASDYGNKFGEPVICGFTRSYGQLTVPSSDGTMERREFIKPIMFTAGLGMLDSRHSTKDTPVTGMIVCKIGGPAYRIGMGGGAASSRVTTAGLEALDFNAVQRGDAEMENRMNRVVRACIEMGANNPIVSIHDQGAGGNGNVLKEIVDPLGARYEICKIPLGDPTMSVMEIWGAEYQENNAFLVHEENLEKVLKMGERENCPVSPVGVVTNDGIVTVYDKDGSTPFNMPLSLVLGKMPQKKFTFNTIKDLLTPMVLPDNITVIDALYRVLSLLDVGSKRYLTNKVDRSVTGLIAQQQCVGILQTPLSNVGVVAQSHLGITGAAVAIGEQPIKGLISNAAQGRMTVGEAITNLMWARITKLEDVKASCNWMWASKMAGEGPKMWDACVALKDIMVELGVGIDGGKDSLSMAAQVNGKSVKCPGEVTLTCYAAVPDITKTVTPDLKCPGESVLLFVDLGFGHARLGGSALATVYNQLGDETSDIENAKGLKDCFNCVQQLLDLRIIESGHDRSDGGLIVTLCEMAFAGNCGIKVDVSNLTKKLNNNTDSAHDTKRARTTMPETYDLLRSLFSEELGIVLEVMSQNVVRVKEMFSQSNLTCEEIGTVTKDMKIEIVYNSNKIVDESLPKLRDTWESTSFALENLQCNPVCVEQERRGMLQGRHGPTYKMTFEVDLTPSTILQLPASNKHRVAVIRQEGSNGDREMLSAFYAAGFDVWDVNMNDLLKNNHSLEPYKGIVFCGGFSYADVNDSAKGWAGVIRFNEYILKQFEDFRKRPDTFSLGICNGCQLMALLGWVPFAPAPQECLEEEQPRFIHNDSGRFESRWSTVQIQKSPAIMLKGMEGSSLGVWLAHGEGKLHVPNQKHMDIILEKHLAPVRYVDDSNHITSEYPMNPNGSPHGIASLCSPDGRHLAMMPHPERCFLPWQHPYLPNDWKKSLKAGPWLRMFQNARTFCDETSSK